MTEEKKTNVDYIRSIIAKSNIVILLIITIKRLSKLERSPMIFPSFISFYPAVRICLKFMVSNKNYCYNWEEASQPVGYLQRVVELNPGQPTVNKSNTEVRTGFSEPGATAYKP